MATCIVWKVRVSLNDTPLCIDAHQHGGNRRQIPTSNAPVVALLAFERRGQIMIHQADCSAIRPGQADESGSVLLDLRGMRWCHLKNPGSLQQKVIYKSWLIDRAISCAITLLLPCHLAWVAAAALKNSPISIGKGNTIVEVFSLAITFSVLRYRSCIASGRCPRI